MKGIGKRSRDGRRDGGRGAAGKSALGARGKGSGSHRAALHPSGAAALSVPSTGIAAACVISLGALLSAACADGTEPDPMVDATLDEAMAIYHGLRSAIQVDPDDPSKIVAVRGDTTVVACPTGGTAALVGTILEHPARGDTSSFGTDFTILPEDCEFESGGEAFQVDGRPGLIEQTTVSIVGSTFEVAVTGSLAGALYWKAGDREGECSVDLRLVSEEGGTDQDPTFMVWMRGSMCGHDVEIDITEDFEVS